MGVDEKEEPIIAGTARPRRGNDGQSLRPRDSRIRSTCSAYQIIARCGAQGTRKHVYGSRIARKRERAVQVHRRSRHDVERKTRIVDERTERDRRWLVLVRYGQYLCTSRGVRDVRPHALMRRIATKRGRPRDRGIARRRRESRRHRETNESRRSTRSVASTTSRSGSEARSPPSLAYIPTSSTACSIVERTAPSWSHRGQVWWTPTWRSSTRRSSPILAFGRPASST